jgi:RimJ/RimL family protein N-acetyltransferase
VTTAPIVLDVPDLADDRLRLRAWRAEDASALVRAWTDPAIIDGSHPPTDCTIEAATRWIEGCDERRRAGLAFDLVIAGTDDQVMGEIGLSNLDPQRRAALIGWWVHAEARGSGVAGAAVALFTDWALGPAGLRALIAEIGADNPASIRVAEQAGYVVITDTRFPQEIARGRAPRVWYVAHSTVK